MAVLITGANRGIGKALYDSYESRGEAVHGTTRNPHNDKRLHRLDVTDVASHRALSREFDSQAIDLLICNAGVYLDKSESVADGYEPELWEKTFAVNVTGVFLTIQNLLPNLQLAPEAKVAIISSQMGSDTIASGGSYIYRASKAAVINLGRNLAEDLKHIGIAVGVYHPGWVRTDMGGSNAAISQQESADGLIERFNALSLSKTGVFETWDGREHAF